MTVPQSPFGVTIVRGSQPLSSSAFRSVTATASLVLLVGTVALVLVSSPSAPQPLSLTQNINIRGNTLNDAIVNIASGKSNIVVQSRKHLPASQGLPKNLPFKAEEPGISASEGAEGPVANATEAEEPAAEEPAAEAAGAEGPVAQETSVEGTPAPPAEGFVAKLYYMEQDMEAVPDVSTLTPNAEGLSVQINYPSHDAFLALDPNVPDSKIVVTWTGLIYITEAGPYTFTTESDDGSHLYIDGAMVADDSGLHGAQKAAGTVELTAGYHEFYCDFFEQEGGEYMVVTYSGPDTSAEEVLLPGFHEV